MKLLLAPIICLMALGLPGCSENLRDHPVASPDQPVMRDTTSKANVTGTLSTAEPHFSADKILFTSYPGNIYTSRPNDNGSAGQKGMMKDAVEQKILEPSEYALLDSILYGAEPKNKHR